MSKRGSFKVKTLNYYLNNNDMEEATVHAPDRKRTRTRLLDNGDAMGLCRHIYIIYLCRVLTMHMRHIATGSDHEFTWEDCLRAANENNEVYLMAGKISPLRLWVNSIGSKPSPPIMSLELLNSESDHKWLL
jgi:hypothetical protein